MQRHAKKTVYMSAPVEQMWRILTDNNGAKIDPLDEDTYENTEPMPGTVFTRATQMTQNETFSFQIKTLYFHANWSIVMEPAAHHETKMTVSNTVSYRSVRYFFVCLFGLSPKKEVRGFIRDIGKKLELDMKRNKQIS